jgi:hypothetical protein
MEILDGKWLTNHKCSNKSLTVIADYCHEQKATWFCRDVILVYSIDYHRIWWASKLNYQLFLIKDLECLSVFQTNWMYCCIHNEYSGPNVKGSDTYLVPYIMSTTSKDAHKDSRKPMCVQTAGNQCTVVCTTLCKSCMPVSNFQQNIHWSGSILAFPVHNLLLAF